MKIDMKLRINALAKAKITTNNFPSIKIISFNGVVDAVKNEMYDYVEIYKIDVSEYDYDINEIKPEYEDEFFIINCDGNKYEPPKNCKIEQILEVLEYKIKDEIV